MEGVASKWRGEDRCVGASHGGAAARGRTKKDSKQEIAAKSLAEDAEDTAEEATTQRKRKKTKKAAAANARPLRLSLLRSSAMVLSPVRKQD